LKLASIRFEVFTTCLSDFVLVEEALVFFSAKDEEMQQIKDNVRNDNVFIDYPFQNYIFLIKYFIIFMIIIVVIARNIIFYE
jgi:hypothetical protein